MGNHPHKLPSVWLSRTIKTPFGEICAAASPTGLIRVWFGKTKDLAQEMGLVNGFLSSTKDYLEMALSQLGEYFSGDRKIFEIPLDFSLSTPFQSQVLDSVFQIPFGKISTYGEIAREMGKPGAVRAVGGANGSNPIPIIIPCHRVVGSDMKLHGYSMPGGLQAKAWLLELEGHKIENGKVIA